MVKNPPANVGDTKDSGWIPGLGRWTAKGSGNPRQYSHLGNPMDRGAWQATVRGLTKSRTRRHTHTHTHTHIKMYGREASQYRCIQNPGNGRIPGENVQLEKRVDCMTKSNT